MLNDKTSVVVHVEKMRFANIVETFVWTENRKNVFFCTKIYRNGIEKKIVFRITIFLIENFEETPKME